ncbi:MAG: hypothetical protein ACC656_08750, partial [Candidatus Heimdallarchaeota archaeon]
HPLRYYDHSYINIQHNENASIRIEDVTQNSPYVILLKGKLKILRSREKWISLKYHWINIFPDLGTYFDVQERYIHPSMDQGLLFFKPVHISAWKNFELDPIKIDMEIV